MNDQRRRDDVPPFVSTGCLPVPERIRIALYEASERFTAIDEDATSDVDPAVAQMMWMFDRLAFDPAEPTDVDHAVYPAMLAARQRP